MKRAVGSPNANVLFLHWNSESCLLLPAFPVTGRFAEVNGMSTDGGPCADQNFLEVALILCKEIRTDTISCLF